jgi:hypothetical protein
MLRNCGSKDIFPDFRCNTFQAASQPSKLGKSAAANFARRK